MIARKEQLLEIAQKKIFFFDLDGTIYLGSTLFPGVAHLIEHLQDNKKKFFFLSNNSSMSTSDYIKKLHRLNLKISVDRIILSQHPTINYLKKFNFQKIFLLGTSSLKTEFKNEGFELTDEEPEIVILAFDQELTYDKLEKAAYQIQNGTPYIATHLDNRCPTEKGYIPDAGGIAALLFKTTEVMPKSFGKPNPEMLLFKLNQIGGNREDAIIFGDRLYTDIKMGIDAEIATCCVLSGETNLDMIKRSENKPDYVIEGIWEYYDSLIP
ncbi:MAG: HAD-IIA family hydrolase [Candidatus Lokiarchaeota archaeon]|nr:HAD-IIA family hydrolase [Candidatus Lokiarchaeota archaeon]MBD3341534.1 HAD-IIA family hydrolase [Candidatus Lokiarchaeota archaeon]